jgi:hypothetical protein
MTSLQKGGFNNGMKVPTSSIAPIKARSIATIWTTTNRTLFFIK